MLAHSPEDHVKDPAKTLTQRLKLLDSKLDSKHAQADAQAADTEEALDGFKACAADSRTRLSIRTYAEEDLEDDDLDTGEEPGEDQEEDAAP